MAMTLEIKSTHQLVTVDGVECRLWYGITSDGVPCHVLVHRVAVRGSMDSSEFEKELKSLAAINYSVEENEQLRARIRELEAKSIDVN